MASSPVPIQHTPQSAKYVPISSLKPGTEGRSRRQRRRQSSSPSQPPKYDATVICHQKFRFQASAAMVNEVIGTTNLLSLLQMAVSTTSGQALFTGVRLRRVSVWGPPAADLVPVTVSVEYASGSSGFGIGNRPQIHADTSVGATRVAAVSAAPDKDSAADMWQNRTSSAISNGAVFILNGPINSIVDVDLDLVLQNGETASGASTSSGLTVGLVYCRPLDGVGGTIAPLNWPVLA
jgi:hypothetical protein